jgi:hypothetical protein
MKNLFTTLSFIVLFISFSYGQDYKAAAGLRFGYPLSISGKFFLNEKGAIEAMVGRRGYSYGSYFTVGALYQHHSAITSVEQQHICGAGKIHSSLLNQARLLDY